MFRVLIVLFICTFKGIAAIYFSMTDLNVTIPRDKGRFPPGNHALATLYAHSDYSLRYTISGTQYLQVYPTTGDVLLSKLFLNDVQNIDQVGATITAEDSIGRQNQTLMEVNVLPLNPLDCHKIIPDLCYWQSAKYRLYENQPPSTIGSLTSPFLREMCSEYNITYTLINSSTDFKLLPPSSNDPAWTIVSTKSLDREYLNKEGTLGRNGEDILGIMCTVRNAQGIVQEVRRDIGVLILDVDDNPPRAQESEINVDMSSNVVLQGHVVEHKDLIFLDMDTPEVNNYKTEIIGDNEKIIKAKCHKYEDGRTKKAQTAVHCKLYFTKTIPFSKAIYSVVLRLTDVTLDKKFPGAEVPIHLRFHNDTTYHPAAITKRNNHPLILYPLEVVKIYRTAATFARITQPPAKHLADRGNFTLHPDPIISEIFNVTTNEGIVFVKDGITLRNNSSEYLRLNITWWHKNRIEYDEINVSIIDDPSRPCQEMKNDHFKSCAEYEHWNDCENEEACALSTGGAFSVTLGRGSGRCIWRGSKKADYNLTKYYATCTPDTNTCPDEICDELEKLDKLICPQDCSDDVVFPTKVNPNTGRGIDMAQGVVACDDTGQCRVGPLGKSRLKKKPKTTTPPPLLQTNVSRQVNNRTNERILGLAKCGTPCILGIVAGLCFLILGAALMVICWRLDRVNKAVRRKFNDETQDLSAPLSDYVDRSMPDPMPLNFDMTTSLADMAVLSIIRKYDPDPKWEFPRDQLVIEQTLGEGEFGRVLRAKALNIGEQAGYTTVAVKTLKDDARESELNDLLSEYQLLKEVSHPNVIKLLGVCTQPGGPIYLVIEFAEHGSLRNYLRRSRHLKSESSRLPTSNIDNTDDNYDQPNVSQVTSKEILCFAWQVCKGMAHLSEIKLVHRDLAARNILLAADKVCKISDFGLTRDIYEDSAYFKKSKGRVPVKWMAPESLSDHVYTHKSDVWSFGILVWELITLGATPYPGIAVQNLFHLLRQGYRMERPDNCSPTLYNIMRSCWHIDPEHRPTFQELAAMWEKLLADKVDYLDLTNNAVHNRSYFCTVEGAETEVLEKPEIDPLNYLSKLQSYVKCGEADKISTSSTYSNEILHTQGYESPVKVPQKVQTPTNDCPQYYTDMAAKSEK